MTFGVLLAGWVRSGSSVNAITALRSSSALATLKALAKGDPLKLRLAHLFVIVCVRDGDALREVSWMCLVA